MITLTQQEVAKVAHLARLELTPDELTRYQAQLSAILEAVAMLDELELGDIPPTAHAVPMQNILADDVIRPGLSLDEALFNAPQQAENQFLIQAVLPEDE